MTCPLGLSLHHHLLELLLAWSETHDMFWMKAASVHEHNEQQYTNILRNFNKGLKLASFVSHRCEIHTSIFQFES